MKIKNVENFRDELFRNLKELYFVGYDIIRVGETYFDIDCNNKCHVTKLRDALELTNIPYGTCRKCKQFYITVSDLGEIDLWKTNYEFHYFDWVTSACMSDIKNKTVASMEVVKMIMNYLYE